MACVIVSFLLGILTPGLHHCFQQPSHLSQPFWREAHHFKCVHVFLTKFFLYEQLWWVSDMVVRACLSSVSNLLLDRNFEKSQSQEPPAGVPISKSPARKHNILSWQQKSN